MAVDLALAKVTDNSIAYTATDDGGGGAAVALTTTALLAVMTAAGIPVNAFSAFLATTANPNSQATQRRRLLGDGSGIAPADRDMRDIEHCIVTVTPRTADGFIVDADVDAGLASTMGEYNITGPAAAGVALVTIQYKHSINQ